MVLDEIDGFTIHLLQVGNLRISLYASHEREKLHWAGQQNGLFEMDGLGGWWRRKMVNLIA